MKKRNIIYTIALLAASSLLTVSCDSFLDEKPDNRSELDTPSKIAKLLVTSYPGNTPIILNELMSDNSDYLGPNNSLGDREGDQMFFWEDITETSDDSPESLYKDYFGRIGQANEALVAIENLGGATTANLRNSKGEALLLRAYNQFMLVNIFGMAYNSQTSSKDLGVYYSKKIESLNEKHQRATVAENYADIEADILAGIPLLNDDYSIPKYHFTKAAAYAFAARFFLYYEKWDQAEKYANLAVGSNPESSLHDFDALEAMPLSTSDQAVKIAEAYCSATSPGNLLVTTLSGAAGLAEGPWGHYKRWAHTNYQAESEGELGKNVWGSSSNLRWKTFTNNSGERNYSAIMKIPFEFQYTDPVAGIGYNRGLNVAFTREEALLNRAEARIMQKKYDEAASDMNIWMHNFFKTDSVLSPASIQAYMKSVPYAYSDEAKMTASCKKHLNPSFTIDAEGSVQESMLQCVLHFLRIETMHQGLRWNDIKRFNIEIPRRLMGADGKPKQNMDWLKKNDKRMAVQIPISIRAAGVDANPRD